ncbi:Glucose-1-phosphate thymidylyltransferase [Labilithrix luteola]|uniref:Glucose-1-phosphate thymidylyltransferase n=1 Tax=Labilithrix luteola TaxID=1391654 RepID=A0A0K1PMU0_9BACT|nr:glucose-1-phosphate thymidylyltransferase RfbA [Labilithrix luteola]AKU94832.1 Glucose-1-phosphate thymidylyltransferase [Labilithrix luteola]
MKAILLAGGSGTRLAPITRYVSKQLVPVYDKPAIYYPLATLMLAGIREIAIISTPRDLPMIEGLLGTGEELGLSLTYLAQPKPEGIAQAFLIAADFIGDSPVMLVLGDNIFYGHQLIQLIESVVTRNRGAELFAYRVRDPERYGVVEFDADGKVLGIEEKPQKPRSNWAVPGLYIYDRNVVELARSLTPSARGELEITDLNVKYLEQGRLYVNPLGRGVAWLDVGTFDSLLGASVFVQALEQRQGLKVACLEEIAYHKRFIDLAQLERIAQTYGSSDYGNYLRQVIEER